MYLVFLSSEFFSSAICEMVWLMISQIKTIQTCAIPTSILAKMEASANQKLIQYLGFLNFSVTASIPGLDIHVQITSVSLNTKVNLDPTKQSHFWKKLDYFYLDTSFEFV